MYGIDLRLANAELRTQDEVEPLVKALEQEGYRPVLRGMAAAAREATGSGRRVDASILFSEARGIPAIMRASGRWGLAPSGPGLLGELFFRDESGFFLQPIGPTLLAGAFRLTDASRQANAFTTSVAEAAAARLDGRRVRGMSFDWSPTDVPFTERPVHWHEAVTEESFTSVKPEYSTKEFEATRALIDSSARAALIELAKLKGARGKDAAAVSKETVLPGLESAGLITTEYLVSCRQDSRAICTISSYDEITRADRSISCPTCHRALGDEKVDEIFAVTELGRSLLRGSRWMSIWVSETLKANGVPEEQIRWSPQSDGEDLDVLVNLFGRSIFFELKDREFGLGDSYPFVFRVTRYRGHVGVVATTERVSEDAKKFINEQRQIPGAVARYHLLEGVDEIEKGIESLLHDESKRGVLRALSPLTDACAFNLEHVLGPWLASQDAKRSRRTSSKATTGAHRLGSDSHQRT